MSFALTVYKLSSKIPKGKVVTYGQLAMMAGIPGAARAVGMCMRANPYAPIVPCHRVVASDGSLTGFSMKGGVVTKKKMLIAEGVVFNGHKVDLEKSQWKKHL